MKYCSTCGTPLELRIPEGDNRPRSCCPGCNAIHYVNPKIVVGSIPTFQGKVLLCKRAIEPRYGYWTLPAGFMELNETTSQGAQRETDEEAGADIEMGELFTLMNVARVGQVHFYYRARLRSTAFNPGHETQEARLFLESEIPWDELSALKATGYSTSIPMPTIKQP